MKAIFSGLRPPGAGPYDVNAAWTRVLKRTISRFVRGNIAAQNKRIALRDEQEKRHERARSRAKVWRSRSA